MSDVRLILTCGLPGAGKTALAKRISTSRPAVRLTKDEWIWALGTDPWDRPMNIKVEQQLWGLAQETLTIEELWRRVDERNSRPPWDSAPITRAHLDEWAAHFQAPDDAELALFDSPPASN